jgi:2-dehydro-3-deoxygluconokinase
VTARLFLSIGEPMVELGRAGDGDGDLWRMGFAGDVLNTLWYARASLPETGWRTALLTRLGTEPFSARMRDFLTCNGLDTAYVTPDEKRSVGLYAIDLSPSGERRFSYWRSASAARGLADDAESLGEAIDAADLVYFSGITLAILPPTGRQNLIDAARAARARGRMVVFDPNIRPALWEDRETMRRWLREGIAAATVGLPSFDDDAELWGDASPEDCLRRWQAAGCGEVAVKNGGGDIAVGTPGNIETITVERIRPVDTTGAGDAFNAGYLAARLGDIAPAAAVLAGHRLACHVIGQRGALIPMEKLRDLGLRG